MIRRIQNDNQSITTSKREKPSIKKRREAKKSGISRVGNCTYPATEGRGGRDPSPDPRSSSRSASVAGQMKMLRRRERDGGPLIWFGLMRWESHELGEREG